jgi:hypothetical protein
MAVARLRFSITGALTNGRAGCQTKRLLLGVVCLFFVILFRARSQDY